MEVAPQLIEAGLSLVETTLGWSFEEHGCLIPTLHETLKVIEKTLKVFSHPIDQ